MQEGIPKLSLEGNFQKGKKALQVVILYGCFLIQPTGSQLQHVLLELQIQAGVNKHALVNKCSGTECYVGGIYPECQEFFLKL